MTAFQILLFKIERLRDKCPTVLYQSLSLSEFAFTIQIHPGQIVPMGCKARFAFAMCTSENFLDYPSFRHDVGLPAAKNLSCVN